MMRHKMAQSNISIRVNSILKKDFDKLCDELGVNMSTAITMFIKAAVREQRIPFALTIKDYNKETQKVIEDANNGIGLSKSYSSVDDMMNEILKDDNV
jgi:DNA-damage-inducible protein J